MKTSVCFSASASSVRNVLRFSFFFWGLMERDAVGEQQVKCSCTSSCCMQNLKFSFRLSEELNMDIKLARWAPPHS